MGLMVCPQNKRWGWSAVRHNIGHDGETKPPIDVLHQRMEKVGNYIKYNTTFITKSPTTISIPKAPVTKASSASTSSLRHRYVTEKIERQ